MARRISEIESLARDLCWAGFKLPKLVGRSKAAYWDDVSIDSKRSYIREAEYLIWVIQRLGIKRLERFDFPSTPNREDAK